MSDPRYTSAYRQARALVLSTQTHCHICLYYVDPTVDRVMGKHRRNCRKEYCPGCEYHLLRGEADHIEAVAKGGHGTSHENLRLAHRRCNSWKGDKSMAWVIKHRLVIQKLVRELMVGYTEQERDESVTDWLSIIGGSNNGPS